MSNLIDNKRAMSVSENKKYVHHHILFTNDKTQPYILNTSLPLWLFTSWN